jgi:multidrug efflux pump subunit AcrA (membrane-fusion protein)
VALFQSSRFNQNERAHEPCQDSYEGLLVERDELRDQLAELKDRYLRSLAQSEQARKRIRAQADETVRLVGDRLRAENAELRAECEAAVRRNEELFDERSAIAKQLLDTRSELAQASAAHAAEIERLQAALQSSPLPDCFWILTHAVFDRMMRVRLFPDHAGTNIEREQRTEMLMRWCQILDYVRAHCRNGSKR